MADTPRIYVACLAAYNNGHLHGEWIDCDQGSEGIWGEIHSMLAESPVPNAEEWAIHDYEGFGSIKLSEYANIDDVAAMSAFIEEHDDPGLAALEYSNGDLERAESMMEGYYGHYDNVGDYAEQYLLDVEGKPTGFVANYIDYDAMGRDFELGGSVITVDAPDGGIYVFSGLGID